MSVRAKFKVSEHRLFAWNPNARTIVLEPQYDQSIPEDKRFCEATPSGRLEMHVTNPAAIEQLAIGKTFYLDFTPVE